MNCVQKSIFFSFFSPRSIALNTAYNAFLPSNTAYNNAFLPSRSLSEHARSTEFPSFADYRFIIHSIKQMEQPPSDIVDVLRPAQLQEYTANYLRV